MITSERIKEIYNITTVLGVDFKLNITHKEIQEFLSSIGYKTIEVEMLVTVNTRSHEGGEVRTINKTTDIRPVILSIPKDAEPPTRDQHLDDHKDKFYFEVYRKEIQNKMKKVLLNI